LSRDHHTAAGIFNQLRGHKSSVRLCAPAAIAAQAQLAISATEALAAALTWADAAI